MADEKTAGNTSPEESLQQAMEHARAINEQILQTAAKAGREMLDGYVRWLEQVAEQQRKLASGPPVSQVDWLAAMLNAQADLTRQFASALRGLPGRDDASGAESDGSVRILGGRALS